MESLSLYQITSAFPALMDNEEITDENKKAIEKELTELLQQKSQNIIGYIKNIESYAEMMKTEENRLSAQRKVLENQVTRFKGYVKECMENNGFTKINTGLGTLSIAKSPISVEVVNEDEIPGEYKTEVTTIKVDKKKIADNYKETGELINGVVIHDSNTNLRIK